MTSEQNSPAIDLAAALRDRFECDRMLGNRVLPVSVPATVGTNPVHPASGTTPSPALRPAQTTMPVARPSAPVFTPQVDPRRVAAGGLAEHFPNAGLGLQSNLPAGELEKRTHSLSVLDRDEVASCTRCGLHAGRRNTVFGTGSPAARIMFVGEGPGADEDATGIPFVGRAGELLTRMIENGMGLRRDEVYICNVVKCRPPQNRTPTPEESQTCKDYLIRQIELIKPEVIVALGGPAAQTLLATRTGITALRGQWYDFYLSGSALVGTPIPVMPTFHPAYLLRSPGEKNKAWADLKMVMARLGIPVPARG